MAVAALGATPAPAPDVLAGDAARVLAAQRRGAIAFSLVYRFTEHGPGHNVDRSARAMVLRDDGTVVKTQASGDDTDKPTTVEDDYRLPIETKYLAEYRFSAGSAACDRCPADAVAVDFTSTKRDDGHGDGTMWIDDSSHRFLALHFHPSALPAHTDSADIAVTFGQVLPDLWDVTLTEQQYNGHELIFHGWGHVEQRQSEYRRFASVADALKALSAAEAPSSAATPQRR